MLSIIATSLFGNKIGERIVTEVNKQIDSELVVEKFDLSLIQSFPNLSANLRKVLLKDNEGKALVEAEKLSVKLGLFPLIRSKVDVRSVTLSDGTISLLIDRNGEGNYNIAKTNTAESEENKSNTEVSVNKAILKNIDVIYLDRSSEQEAILWVDNANFTGAFSNSQFSLKSKAQLLTQKIVVGNENYLVGKDAAYEAEVDVDLEKGLYELKEVALTLGKNTFVLNGSVEQQGVSTHLDLAFKNDGGDIASLMQLLPDEMIKGLGNLKSRGNLLVEGSAKGITDGKNQPAIKAAIQLSKGEIRSPELGKNFEDVTLSLRFDNGRRQDNSTSILELENLVGYFGKDRVEAHLLYENFNRPNIDFSLDGVIPMAAVYGLLGNKKISKGSGEIVVKDLSIEGLLNDLRSPSRLSKVESRGDIEFLDASLTYNGEKLIFESGSFSLNNSFLKIDNLIFKGAGNDLAFRGSAYNALPVFFADSVNSKRAELEFDADLKAKSIDLDRLFALNAIDSTSNDIPTAAVDSMKEARIQQREKFTDFLKGSFNAVIDDFNYNKIRAKDFSGKIEFINNEMDITGSAMAMDGELNLEAQVFFEDEPRLTAKMICDQVNARQFFTQTDNFGQEVLIDKNINGKLNAKIAIDAFWDGEGRFMQDRMRVLAGIGIVNGELNNFKMLKQFSSVVKIQDLMRIKFSNLQNFLEYRRNRLVIPVMFIQSNAMNLTINGEHTYNNEIYYNIKVNAGQILANKFKRHNPKLKPLKARKRGFFNLYYNIYGDINEYEIKSAKKDIKQDFERSSRKKREIQLALEEKFGIVELVEEPIEWRDIPEYDEGETTDEDEEFIDWEEEKRDTTKSFR